MRGLAHRPWGDALAYRALLNHWGIAFVDVPRAWPEQELVQRVRALTMIAPVAMAVSPETPRDMLLDAGAFNIVCREAPVGEIEARIRADIRWLRNRVPGTLPDRGTVLRAIPQDRKVRIQKSQALLLDILLGSRGPFCCHDIRWLLGGPSGMLSLPALRGRLLRMEPVLAQHGYTLSKSHNWGRDIYELVPSAGASTPSLRSVHSSEPGSHGAKAA
ncbi:hypothetical protein AB0D38_45645 [Streptomyces sp. NPDC048279]|uniref:hypothetical protein n=1 Tax=Streptomyces sp. NPDC048279 TaxID=3154714 RepID=UPI0034295877